ncbi:MAG: tetratricopeptide repeat protein [Bacteriovoracaceae bacterium]
MNMFKLLILFLMVSCSSTKNTDGPVKKVDNAAFKKEKILNNNEVADYYLNNSKALNPALQDETLDRYTKDEVHLLENTNDPLVEISARCSKGEFDQAFAVASKVFNRYQKVAAYWNQVANCHLNQGSHRKALLFYNKALEVVPNYVPALNNIGVMYSRQGQDQKALVAFEKANKQSRFAKTPRYNLAKLYLSYGIADLALPMFQSLLSSSPNDADLLNAVGSCYFLMSDYQQAYNYYAQIPRGEIEKSEVGLNLAITLKKLGRVADAQKIFKAVKGPKNTKLKQYYLVVETQLGEI